MITLADKLACLERELAIRKHVYPNRVMTHRMSQQRADYEISLMEAILEDYRLMIEIRDEATAQTEMKL